MLDKLISGYWISQAIYVAARLKIADRLAHGPLCVADLAAGSGAHAPSLARLLRALASVGVFIEIEPDHYALTPLAEQLRSDVPDSKWALAVMMGEEHYRAYGELLYSVQTGRTAFEKIYGVGVFDYLSQHPDQGAIFDAAMTGVHGGETAPMVEACDLTGVSTLADVGGGNGSVLAAMLAANPRLRGILFDLPPVIERARPALAEFADRCQLVIGDFFQSAPIGADVYLMRHIIHDWDDRQAEIILRNIRKVVPPAGRLLVAESVIPPGNDPFFGKLLDLTMLVLPGGKERTAEEYQRLFQATGFRLSRIIPTRTAVSLLEGLPDGAASI